MLVRRIVLIAAVVMAAAAALPARAMPSSTRITGVYRLPCSGDVCADGNGDHQLDPSATVTGSIQIQGQSSSSIGLEWARLDARRNDGEWFCLKQWDLSGTSFTGVFDWDTRAWPGDCPDGLQADTRNGTYDVRLVAKEKVSGDQAVSSAFTVDVNNRPSPPAWAGDLAVAGAEDRAPLVTLRFDASPQPDVFEYHYIRLAPGGDESEWAVSAAKPGGQGCDLDGTTYVCYDDDFPQYGFGGSYTYALIAYRSSPVSGDSCVLPPQPDCVQSSLSETREITIDEPDIPEPTDDPTVGTGGGTGGGGTRPGTRVHGGSITRSQGGSGSGATYCDFYCGSYEKKLPYGQQPYAVARGGKGSADATLAEGLPADDNSLDPQRLRRSIAGGLLLLLAAAHAARVLRRA